MTIYEQHKQEIRMMSQQHQKEKQEQFQIGEQIGEQKGKLEGRLENKLETAKKLLIKGMDKSVIVEVTELSLEKINELEKELGLTKH